MQQLSLRRLHFVCSLYIFTLSCNSVRCGWYIIEALFKMLFPHLEILHPGIVFHSFALSPGHKKSLPQPSDPLKSKAKVHVFRSLFRQRNVVNNLSLWCACEPVWEQRRNETVVMKDSSCTGDLTWYLATLEEASLFWYQYLC